MQNKIATNNTLKTVSGLMASQYRAGNAPNVDAVLRDANASNDFKRTYGAYIGNYIHELDQKNNVDKAALSSTENLTAAIQRQGGTVPVVTSKWDAFKTGLKDAGSVFKASAINIGANLAVSAAIQGIATAFDYVSNKQERAIESGDEVIQNYKDINEQMAQSSSWIETNGEKYTTLSKGVSSLGTNLGLTNEEYAEYQELASQIATQFPELVSGYDSLGKPIIKAATDVDTLKATLKTQKVNQYTESVKNAKDVIGKLNAEVNQDKNWFWEEAGTDQQLQSLEKFQSAYEDAFKNKNGNKFLDLSQWLDDGNFVDALDNAGVSIKDFGKLINELNDSQGKLKANSDTNDFLNTIIGSQEDLRNQRENSADELKSYIPAFFQEQRAYQNLLDDAPNIESELTSLINSFSYEDLEKNGFTGDKAISKLKSWSQSAVKELQDKDIQDALNDVFTINDDSSKQSFDSWQKEADAALDKASEKTKSFSREQMREASGIKDQWEELRGIQTKVAERWDDTTGIKSRDLSIEDLETLGTMLSDTQYDGQSFEQMVAQIQNVQDTSRLTLENMQKVVTDTTASLSTLQTATSEASSATGLTADTITSMGGMFSDIDNFDSAALFKNTANGVKLNTKALSSLLAVQHDIKANDFTRSIEEQTKAIAEQNDVVQAQTKGTDAYKTEQDKLKSMFADLSALQQAQSQYHALYKQQQELFSDYGQWQQAQSTANAGDKYNNMVSGLQAAKGDWDKGLVGTDDFKSFAKLISPSGATDDVNFAENYAKAARYLTEDESGVKAFLNDLSSKGLADFNEESQQWSYNVKDMAEAAKQMGMGKDFMSNMFGRLEDYGFHNNVISDAEDGVLKLSDAYSNLAESEARLEDLKKNDPTNTTAIEQAEKEVSGYKQDIDELGTNLKEVASHTAENYNRELETAKNQMKTLADERERILKSNEYGENTQAVADYMQSQIDQLGQNYGLDSSALQQQAEQAAKAYSDALQNATIENPVTPDFGEDTASADAYASAVDKVQQANKDNNQILSDSIKTLQQYNSEQVKGIDLLDGAYDSDELKPAEQALDNICQSLGLTSEEAGLLGQVLESMGIIKPEVDDSEVKQAKTDAEETKQTYDNLGDSTVSINADVSGEDSVASFVDQCSSIQQGMTTTITATVSGGSEVESLESGLEQIPDNTPTTVDVTVNNQQDLDNIQSKVDSLNAGGKDITLNAHIKPDSDSEVEVKAKDTTVKVTPDPKEVEVTAKPVKVDVQPSQKEVSVSAKVTNKPNATSQGTINYKKGSVEKADGTTSQGIINYKKGDVEKADGTVSTGIINYNLGNVATPTGMVATGVINYTLGSVAKPGKAAGTFGQARAYAQGSLTDLSAYAGGHVSLPRDEKALVNEVGTESIVRDGQWSLIPGGAHLTNLKKGDIIFSASQTDDLLKNGATPGHARAYAQGSLSDISLTHAFGGGSGWGGFGGGLANKTSVSSSSSSQQATSNNTKATNENTSAKKSNTKSTKDSTETFNWVETKLKKFSKAVERISNQITDYITSTLKITLLKKQINAINKEIKVTQQGYDAYMKKAESIGISQDYKDKVINGTFSVEEIDTSTDAGKKLAKDIKSFQEFYNSAEDCKDKIQELNNTLLEVYDTLANMPIEKAEKAIDKLKAKFDSLSNTSDTISTGGSAINALREQIKKDYPKLATAKQDVEKATTARSKTKKTKSTASKNLTNAKSDADNSGKKLINTSKKQTSSYAKQLKTSAKSHTDRATFNAFSQAIREGKPVSLKGLKGETLKYAKSYNNSLKQGNTIETRVKAGKTVRTSGISNVLKSVATVYNKDRKETNTAQKAYDNAKKADDKALKNLKEATSNKESLDRQTTADQRLLASSKTLKSYSVQNKLLDAELSNLKSQVKTRQKAVTETSKKVDEVKGKRDTAVKSRDGYGNYLLNNKKNKFVADKLTDAQKAVMKAGKKVSTKGITDPKVLKRLNEYNKRVEEAEKWNQKLTIRIDAQTDAVNAAADAEREYAEALVENEKKKLENISNYYDSHMSQYENRNDLLNTYMDRMQTRGYNLSTNFYAAQIEQYQKIASEKKAELAAMEKQFSESLSDPNSPIKVGTEEYYEMKDSIDQVKMSIAETTNSIVEMQAAIRDLEWEQFDQLQDAISRITSESDFLIDLMNHKDMYDKDGKMTEQGLATMGLHGVNYNTYMAQADKYKEEMLKISAELANDPNNQKLIDRKNELIDAQQQAILSAENEKDSIKDLIQDGIDKQLDALDDLIDKYLDCLDSEKELWEYRKKIGEQSEKIASLQKQLSSLQGDNSEENKAKLQKLKEDLKSAQDDMEETQYDKYVSDQKKLLDELKEDYKKALDDRMDNVDALISDAITSINSNSSNISQTLQTESQKVGYTLSGEMQTIWSSQSQTLSIYDGKFETRFTGVTTAIGNIYDRQKDMIGAINNMAEAYIKKVDDLLTQGNLEEVKQEPDENKVAEGNPTPDPPKVSDKDSIKDAVLVDPDEPPKPSKKDDKGKTDEPKKTSTTGNKKAEVGDKVTYASGKYYEASDGTGKTGNYYLGKKVKIARIKKGAKYPYSIVSADGKTELGWVKLNQLKGYASGIMRVPNDQLAWTQEQGEEAIVRNDGSILTPLSKDVSVLNADMTKNLWDFMGNPGSFLSDYSDSEKFGVKNVDNSSSVDVGGVTIQCTLPNVIDSKAFVRELVNNKDAERAIKAMTIDRIRGGSSLAKYKYRN